MATKNIGVVNLHFRASSLVLDMYLDRKILKMKKNFFKKLGLVKVIENPRVEWFADPNAEKN